MSEVWVARQPIFDATLATYGYELLFRSPESVAPDRAAGDSATAQVLVGTLADIGLDRLVGSARAFVNLTRDFVIGRLPLPIPPKRAVLEILEDIVADSQVVEGVQRLKRQGFMVALDDFVEVRPENEALLPYMDVIKVECLNRTPAEIARSIAPLARYDVRLLAEKLESQAELDACRKLGFHYFQGYFLERPAVMRATTLAPQRLQLLQLVAELHAPSLSIERIEELLRADVALSFRLISCVNSVSYTLARRVDTVREALMYLGLNYVRGLVSLLLLTRLDDKPAELTMTAMTRSRMCEYLAKALHLGDPRAAFTVGMFSLLDAFFDKPIEVILQQLPVGQEVQRALIGHEGPLGALLSGVIAYERGQWEVVERLLGQGAPVQAAFRSAVDWVVEIKSTAQA